MQDQYADSIFMNEYDLDGNLIGKEKPSIWLDLYETIKVRSRFSKFKRHIEDFQEQKAID